MKVAARNEALEKAAEELQKKIELKVMAICSFFLYCHNFFDMARLWLK